MRVALSRWDRSWAQRPYSNIYMRSIIVQRFSNYKDKKNIKINIVWNTLPQTKPHRIRLSSFLSRHSVYWVGWVGYSGLRSLSNEIFAYRKSEWNSFCLNNAQSLRVYIEPHVLCYKLHTHLEFIIFTLFLFVFEISESIELDIFPVHSSNLIILRFFLLYHGQKCCFIVNFISNAAIYNVTSCVGCWVKEWKNESMSYTKWKR